MSDSQQSRSTRVVIVTAAMSTISAVAVSLIGILPQLRQNDQNEIQELNKQLKTLESRMVASTEDQESAEKFRISGKLTGLDGAEGGPLQNAQLFLFSTEEPERTELSDDMGGFVFRGVPSGQYWILVRNTHTKVSGRGLIDATHGLDAETDVYAAEVAYKVEREQG